jgi:hypothetical protein
MESVDRIAIMMKTVQMSIIVWKENAGKPVI